ncbi:hypothetical protein HK28_11665 [Acetobacter sp. DsW_063]|nr:hypothetical protein HK28_11665 [Acetobacter sp. DsW_063]
MLSDAFLNKMRCIFKIDESLSAPAPAARPRFEDDPHAEYPIFRAQARSKIRSLVSVCVG